MLAQCNDKKLYLGGCMSQLPCMRRRFDLGSIDDCINGIKIKLLYHFGNSVNTTPNIRNPSDLFLYKRQMP